MARCYSWAEYTERYGETEAEHRCDLCGGWVATCGCPPEADDDEADSEDMYRHQPGDEPEPTDMAIIRGALRLIAEHREAS